MSANEFLEETDLYRSHLESAPEYPAIIQMELTSRCNLRCIMCPISSEQRKLKDDEVLFSFDELKKFEGAIKSADELELTGFGEDLYHPQALDILRWFKSLKVGINVTTNGQLLTPELSKIVVEEGLCDVFCFSIDAATGHTYRRIRRGGRWDRLTANLQALKKAKDEAKTKIPVLYFSFCAMKRNICELPDFVRMAKSFGVAKVIVQHVFENKFTVGENLINHPELAAKFIAEAKEVSSKLDIVLDVMNISPADTDGVAWSERALIFSPKLFREKNRLIKACEFPWTRCFIRPDRTVQACAITWVGLILGNLRKNDIEQIWRGETYKKFRLDMGAFDTPDECVICMYRGWKKPVSLNEMRSFVDCSPADNQFGVGWHAPERDKDGRWSRWTRRQNSIFLKNSNFALCELELYRHPDAPKFSGEIRVNDAWEYPFSHNELWGEPLKVPIPSGLGEILKIDVMVDRLWRPCEIGIYGSRNVGLLFYGAKLKVKESELKSKIYVADADDSAQLGFGFLPSERRGLKKVRWTQKRAYLALRSGGSAISVWGYTPFGLEPRIVEVKVNKVSVGKIKFENANSPKRYKIPVSIEALGAGGYSVLELCALNAEDVPESAERPVGIIVYKIAMG